MSIQEVPLDEFKTLWEDPSLEEGIYYSRFTINTERVLVFISGSCPELEEPDCKIYDGLRRPNACKDNPIGGKVCNYKRRQKKLPPLPEPK